MRPIRLDPSKRSAESKDFEDKLRGRIAGQDEAVQAVINTYQVFCAGLSSPGRPIASLLFLGPTGSGKTRTVEATAEILLGDPRAVVKVDCGEFQHSHEIAKLVGSPPGYLGHRETQPLITQESLARFHTDKLKISFILFDEIEKASDSLWQLLLGMLDKATLTLGDNRRVDLSQSMIFMTSNLGGADITELMTGGMGFSPAIAEGAELNQKIGRTAEEAAKHKFSPEFMNRIDKVLVFHPLKHEHLEEILTIELKGVQERIIDVAQWAFLFKTSPEARAFLLKQGTDIKYGARHLKRAIERYVIHPFANILTTGQLKLGDEVLVDYEKDAKELTFSKVEGGALVRMMVKEAEKLDPDSESDNDGIRLPAATVAAEPDKKILFQEAFKKGMKCGVRS